MVALGLTLMVAGCSHSTADRGVPASPTTAARPATLVVIGADAAFGVGLSNSLRDSWPQMLYLEAFPVSAVLVNGAVERATVRSAASSQARLAIDQHATVAAIWLDAPDSPCTATTTASTYVPDLDALIAPLRAANVRVLIGNISRAQPCSAAFDDAIDEVASTRAATVVDLASALAANPAIGPRSSVTRSISRTIAETFSAALASQ